MATAAGAVRDPAHSANPPVPRRIIHVAAPGQFGGLEQVVSELATGQHDAGLRVHVVLLIGNDEPEPPLAGALRSREVPVSVVRTPIRSYPRQWRMLRDLLRSERPDVVHSHGYVADVLTCLARPAGLSAVATVHGFTGGDWKNRAYEWMQCWAYRSMDAVVAVSRPLVADLVRRGVAERQIELVPNARGTFQRPLPPADARRQLAIPEGCFSVGWVGRISREKGLDVLIGALPALRDLSMRLTVIGSGPEQSRLARRAEEIGVASLIRWAGVLPAAGRLMPAFDVLVNSSRTEGTPITLLEAMDADVPIVATAVGGVPDLLGNDRGLLVTAERPGDLAAAIRSVHDDRASAWRRVGMARAHLTSALAIAPWIAAYERVYARAERASAREHPHPARA